MFYELYKDAAVFETHESMPHTRRFLAEREQHLTSHSVQRLHGAAVAGIRDDA